MHKKILEYINKEKLIPANTTIIVGVSGGPDSTFLTETLVALKKPLKIEKIILAHVNHHTRDNSTNDQYTVENLAKKHNLPLIIKNAQFKNPTEENMRNARIRFFKKTAQTYGAQKIALGHTQDDNIETFLLFLLRGSGLNGLSGIQQKKKQPFTHFSKHKKNHSLHISKNTIFLLLPILQTQKISIPGIAFETKSFRLSRKKSTLQSPKHFLKQLAS